MIRKFLTVTAIGVLGTASMFLTGCSIQETSAQELKEVQSSISVVHTEKTKNSTVTTVTTKQILHTSTVTTVTKEETSTSAADLMVSETTAASTAGSISLAENERINSAANTTTAKAETILKSSNSTSSSTSTTTKETTTTEETTAETAEETTEAEVTASGTVTMVNTAGAEDEYAWSYFADDTYVYFPNREAPRFTLTWKDYYLLCNCVAHEAGGCNIPIQQKALVAEVIMNRVYNAYGGLTEEYPDAIYSIITAKGQFSGSGSYANLNEFSYKVINSNGNVEVAVCEFLCHYGDEGIFDEGYTGFWGDGRQNHFR